jgi:CcmD family protein
MTMIATMTMTMTGANGYLFAAYAATWIIHIAYLATIVSRYSRLKTEIEALKKSPAKS